MRGMLKKYWKMIVLIIALSAVVIFGIVFTVKKCSNENLSSKQEQEENELLDDEDEDEVDEEYEDEEVENGLDIKKEPTKPVDSVTAPETFDDNDTTKEDVSDDKKNDDVMEKGDEYPDEEKSWGEIS